MAKKAKQVEEVNEEVNEATGEVTQSKKTRSYEMNDDSLPKWNFIEHPVFEGVYLKTKHIIPEDEKIKPFDMHVFRCLDDDKKYFIDSSHTISKTIETWKSEGVDFEKTAILIEYGGKTTVKSKPFNIFEIGKCEL